MGKKDNTEKTELVHRYDKIQVRVNQMSRAKVDELVERNKRG